MELYEIVSSRKAKENAFYVYKGIVYAYSKISKIKHQDRFRRVCKADNIDKLGEDFKNNWTIIYI